jgi:riboflavin kinase/FMN adenylyltransferase
MNAPLDLSLLSAPSAIAIGTFDGVHLGHRSVIREAITFAAAHQLQAAVLSFDNHPLSILAPDKAPGLLTTATEKAQLLQAMGATPLLMPFTRELSHMSPETFITDVLVKRLQVKHISVGYNFNFGHQARGNGQLLKAFGERHGFSVSIHPPYLYQDSPVTSTRIRQLLQQGHLTEALPMLDQQWPIEGEVVRGQGIATTLLGVPTANLQLDPAKLLPTFGVYACEVTLPEGGVHPGIMNLGMRPTFSGLSTSLEVYLFDLQRDLYGQKLSVQPRHFIRPEQRFSGPEALRAQIHQDIEVARQLLHPL